MHRAYGVDDSLAAKALGVFGADFEYALYGPFFLHACLGNWRPSRTEVDHGGVRLKVYFGILLYYDVVGVF